MVSGESSITMEVGIGFGGEAKAAGFSISSLIKLFTIKEKFSHTNNRSECGEGLESSRTVLDLTIFKGIASEVSVLLFGAGGSESCGTRTLSFVREVKDDTIMLSIVSQVDLSSNPRHVNVTTSEWVNEGDGEQAVDSEVLWQKVVPVPK